MNNVKQSKEAIVEVNGVELAYDTFGESSDAAMLLIMGLGEQMIRWDDAFCRLLAAEGYFVIRYDNRDVGKSTKFESAGIPNVMALMMAAQKGEAISASYTLTDMAEDAVGLLDALRIKVAHLVGVSMGGMIAQTVAINHPTRVRTLTSIMSTTSNPDLPLPRPEALAIYQQPPITNRADYIESTVQKHRILHGKKYPLDEARARQYAAHAYDRSYYPAGVFRHLAAILASGSRKKALETVQIPTLVIHGDADPLVPVEGGKDTAATIPGAKLLIIEGMGHDIPPEVAPQIIEAISRHAI